MPFISKSSHCECTLEIAFSCNSLALSPTPSSLFYKLFCCSCPYSQVQKHVKEENFKHYNVRINKLLSCSLSWDCCLNRTYKNHWKYSIICKLVDQGTKNALRKRPFRSMHTYSTNLWILNMDTDPETNQILDAMLHSNDQEGNKWIRKQ